MNRSIFVCAAGALAAVAGTASTSLAQESLHFTYLWHLEQPIYWPDRDTAGVGYEDAWRSIQRTDAGAAHPENNLRDIFGKADRVAVYQYRVRDSIDAIDWAPEAGAQVSYSGGLIRNVESLAQANQLGYGGNPFGSFQQARGWRTQGASKPRLDMVQFSYHHALMPLVDEDTQRMEIRAYQAQYASIWGNSAPMSRGFFPSEMAFSTRLIKVLDEEGIDWSIVSGEKISRANQDYPVVLGSGGVNTDPPNKADMINPGSHDYYRLQISRGCGPAEAFPQSFQPQRAQYVDPETGQVHEIIVVPASQSISWIDGYNPMGTEHFNALQSQGGAAAAATGRPMLAVLAHDGDNAFGGGYSYYMEATPNLVSAAQSQGMHATVVEEYLADHPVPANAIVHVEDGGWVNADGDFGAPSFLNWNWPPVLQDGSVDVENGWAEDIRNWAVITAAQNAVSTADQIATDAGAAPRPIKVVRPDFGTTNEEMAWHHFLGALNSGYMYYGTAIDMEVKPAIACNEALFYTASAIANGTDETAPTIWIPQRWPWNPGSVNFGPAHGYQQRVLPSDFWVWTFVDDVSGVSSVTLRYRVDADGENPLLDHANETYAGGVGVGAWQDVAMTARVFPATNVYNDPNINFFEMPLEIADQYHAKIEGLSEVLVDYYVEAVDSLGNVRRSPIQHVWIGDGAGATDPGGGGPRVEVSPETLTAGETATVTYDPAGGPISAAGSFVMHYGFDGWSRGVMDAVMSPNGDGTYDATVSLLSDAGELNFVFNDGNGNWDNNGGQDWRRTIEGASAPSFVIDGTLDAGVPMVASNGDLELYAAFDPNNSDVLYLAASSPNGGDHFVVVSEGPGSPQTAMWGKSGQVASWGAFIGAESDNGFAGWFDAASATMARGSVLEATIDLAAEFGTLENLGVALARYQTSDGGTLMAQAPAGDGDGDLEFGEFYPLGAAVGPCSAADLAEPFDTLDLSDVQTFLIGFSGQDPVADIVPDGNFDLSDVQTFLIAFGIGCP